MSILTCLDETLYSFSQPSRALSKDESFLYLSFSSARGISLDNVSDIKKPSTETIKEKSRMLSWVIYGYLIDSPIVGRYILYIPETELKWDQIRSVK